MSARLAPTKRKYANFLSCKNMSAVNEILYSSNKTLVFSSVSRVSAELPTKVEVQTHRRDL
jgi:hypothetical protein